MYSKKLPTPIWLFSLSFFLVSCIKDHDLGVPYQVPVISKQGVALPYSVLGNLLGVEVRNGGFGSSATAHPYNPGEFYALTDRGPNADATGGKYFPIPDYTPRIGHFRLTQDGKIEKIAEILIKDPSGKPISGRPIPPEKEPLVKFPTT